MKKIKSLWLFSFLIVLALIFSGCGSQEKVTAEDLLKESREKMAASGSVSGNVSMDVTVSYEQSGISGSLSMEADLDMEVTTEPQASHMKGTVSFLGMDIGMETYVVEENGKAVAYTCVMNEWTREESGDISYTDKMKDLLGNFDAEELELTLAEDTEKFEDKDVYVLTGELKGDLLAKMMEASGDTLGSALGDLEEGVDYSKLSADMRILIYKDSRYVAQISIDMNGMNDMADLGEDVSFDKCNVVISYHSFDDVEEIQVPEEAKSASSSGGTAGLDLFGGTDEPAELPEPEMPDSLDNGELIQDDQGNYLLEGHYDDITARIALPEGFALDEENSDPDCLIFDLVQDDYEKQMYVLCTVYLLEPTFGEDVFSDDHKQDVQMMSTDSSYTDVQLSEVQTLMVGDWEVKYTTLSYTYGGTIWTVEYNTWAIQDEDKIISCDFTEQSYAGECDLVPDMEAVISSLYSGIRIN